MRQEPQRPSPVARIEQLKQRRACGLLTEAEAVELKKLSEPAEREAPRTWQFSQLTHRLVAGLIERDEYLKERNRLTEQFERGENSPLLFESQSPAERKKRLWEQHRAGKLSMNECLIHCAEIRVAEEKTRMATLRHERQLLIENGRTKFQILERTSAGRLKVAGILSVADKRNGNGRVYPKAIWAKQIEKLQPALREKRLIGAADHPPDGVSKIEHAAILWDKIYLDTDGVTTKGEGYVLNTRAGTNLRALIEAGVPVDISSRGFGTLEKKTYNGESVDFAADDFDLVTFDCVLGGSVSGAEIRAA